MIAYNNAGTSSATRQYTAIVVIYGSVLLVSYYIVVPDSIFCAMVKKKKMIT